MVSISPDTLRLLESMVHTPHATYEELNLLDAGVEPEAIREQRLQRAYRVLGIVNDDQMDGARGPPTKRRRCSDPENQISDQQGPDGRSIDQQRSVSRRRPYVRTTEAREAHHSQRPRSRSSTAVSPTTPVRGNRSILEPPTSPPPNSAHEIVNGSPQSNGRRDSRRESLSSTPVSPTAPTYSGFPSAGLSTSRRLSTSSSVATPSPVNGYASPATTNGSSMRNSRSMVSLPLNRGQQQPRRRSPAHRPSSSTTSLTSIPESQTARQLRDEESSDDNRTNGT
ncbi:Hypothetical predicted protein [Lecanosticta acicola]|uniref:Uncharacterized protein n=1 Tax=Lecanosticta acicola TaxID=111012 RepID=A0AAI9E9Q0_9PEZI|nr:Hypothetical predicted protein [Lecanosticta acicola]